MADPTPERQDLRERTCDGSDDPAKRCGRHHPTENGNMMGGYDCCCGQPWLASFDHCTMNGAKGDPVSPRDQMAAALRYKGGDLGDEHDEYELADIALAVLVDPPRDLREQMAGTMPHADEWAAARSAFDAVTTMSLGYQRLSDEGRRAVDALGNLLAVYEGYGEAEGDQ